MIGIGLTDTSKSVPPGPLGSDSPAVVTESDVASSQALDTRTNSLYITIYLVLYNTRFVAQSTSPTQCLTKTYFCHPTICSNVTTFCHPFFSEKISSEELHSLTICLHFNYYETNKSWQHSRNACKSQGFLVLQYVQLSSRRGDLLWQHDIQSLKVYGM